MAGRRTTALGIIAVAREVGISLRQLYYWIHVLRVVQPRVDQHGTRRFLRFSQPNVRTLRRVKHLLDQGYTLRAAARLAGSSPAQAVRPQAAVFHA